ncbi:MAG TPA: ribosome recycling factor [Dehalococcoidia bacterium]|nr:ribosome recycling factor [Dehalococcoidia bacterium]
MVEDILRETESKMEKAVEALKRDLAGIRGSRAAPALVQHVKVDYFGVPTPINQLANISVPEARLLAIQPWDKSSLSAIEKAILKSDLGLTPSNDGNLIRLPIPPLSQERRKELARLVGKRVEEGRVTLRNLRRDAIESLREREKSKEISQDELNRSTNTLQKLTDSFISRASRVGEAKEAELLEA